MTKSKYITIKKEERLLLNNRLLVMGMAVRCLAEKDEIERFICAIGTVFLMGYREGVKDLKKKK